jgi:hypothetical protein
MLFVLYTNLTQRDNQVRGWDGAKVNIRRKYFRHKGTACRGKNIRKLLNIA